MSDAIKTPKEGIHKPEDLPCRAIPYYGYRLWKVMYCHALKPAKCSLLAM